jgi:hypothetical protein
MRDLYPGTRRVDYGTGLNALTTVGLQFPKRWMLDHQIEATLHHSTSTLKSLGKKKYESAFLLRINTKLNCETSEEHAYIMRGVDFRYGSS